MMLHSLFRSFENIIVLDVETTGLSPQTDEIIELAAVRVDKRGDVHAVADEFDLLLRLSEGKRLPPEISHLTGITERQLLEEGAAKAEACKRLEEMLSSPAPLVIAYNAQFDLCFLYYMLAREGRQGALKNAKFLDALTVYKDRQPYPHKLSDAVSSYKLETQNTHRAIDDAKAALELMRAMEEERDDLERYINLFGFNPRYGVSGPKISSIRYVEQPYAQGKKLYER